MTIIERLAREVAARDVREDLDPVNSIEEMKLVLAVMVFREYERVYPEVRAAVRTQKNPRCICAGAIARTGYTRLTCPIHGLEKPVPEQKFDCICGLPAASIAALGPCPEHPEGSE